jgi:hypothetical protein
MAVETQIHLALVEMVRRVLRSVAHAEDQHLALLLINGSNLSNAALALPHPAAAISATIASAAPFGSSAAITGRPTTR